MNILKQLAEKETIIKLETQDKEEFYAWYIKNGGGTEYRSLKELDYNTIALWYWEEKDTSYYNYSSGKYDYTWKQLKQKYNIGGNKMFKKEDLKSGKHWVETKDGRIGIWLKNGVLFQTDAGRHKNQYNEDLTYFDENKSEEDIAKVYKPINNDVGGFKKEHLELLWERNTLKPITSLDQLEQVRREMCEKYGTSFYITSEIGRWETKFNGLVQQVGVVGEAGVVVDHPKNCNKILREDNNFNSEINIYLDRQNQDKLTSNSFRAVDLEKEGYELKLGNE